MAVRAKTREEQIEAFKSGLKELKDNKVQVFSRRITLGTANVWIQMPQPPPEAVYWTLRNESTPQIIDVSYEETPADTNPEFFRLTARGTTRDTVRETYVPQAIWVRVVDDATVVVYFDYAVQLREGTDAYMDLSGGLPG